MEGQYFQRGGTTENLARHMLHESVGEHWWKSLTDAELRKTDEYQRGMAVGEGHRCRICGKTELFRGPGG